MSGRPAASSTGAGLSTRGPGPGTIAAIATPPGEGAIGIVRLSGPDAVAIAAGIFASSRGISGAEAFRAGRGVWHGEVRDEDGPLDEVLLHVMRAPHSYTREDVVEINCHGGAGPVGAVLELVLKRGARLAEPGEFTKRAFLNGRIDLAQAESVMDRIQAQTRAALRAAASTGRGELSRAVEQTQADLLEALARVEAAVDFPEDDLPELVDEALRARLVTCRAHVRELVDRVEGGRLLREGARVAIAGRPNVGKSSLFNALLRDARAIVTAVPGTTRDLIEEVITLGGIPVRLSDTAGLRSTADEVERAGIAIARSAIEAADAVLLVHDLAEGWTAGDAALAEQLAAEGVPVVLAGNKRDLNPKGGPLPGATRFAASLTVSAATGDGLHELEAALRGVLAGAGGGSTEHAILAGARQREALSNAAAALDRALAAYGGSPEFLGIDLREAVQALGQVTGTSVSEAVLDRVFARFCIGK